jgi:hypothetical protein
MMEFIKSCLVPVPAGEDHLCQPSFSNLGMENLRSASSTFQNISTFCQPETLEMPGMLLVDSRL